MTAAAEAARTLVQRGYVRLPRAVPTSTAAKLHGLLWEEYGTKYGIVRNDLRAWSAGRHHDLRLYGAPPKALTESHFFAELRGYLSEASAELFGPLGCRHKGKATMFADCPDFSGCWSVPYGWHTDLKVCPGDPWPKYVYAFAFLDDVGPQGGSTMVLAGSAQRMQSVTDVIPVGGQTFKDLLSKESDFCADLFNERPGVDEAARARRLMNQTVESEGIHMAVEEMLGDQGDILLWDPRALHSASRNTTDRPRSVIKFRLELGHWRQRQMEAQRL